MSPRFDTSNPETREEGVTAAAAAIGKGELVVIPTDTVYGIAADAFDAAAVGRLLQAKGRGRDMPPPVLVSSVTTMDALAVDIPDWVRDLTDKFWPGPLTVVLFQQTSLDWDLGETRGTVAVRMPDHHIALELLQRTGPLAVSSANTTGKPAALDADQALEMLGTEVTAVLDAGPTAGELASTIIDCTGDQPRVLRQGALPWEEIRALLEKKGHSVGDADGKSSENKDSDDEADAEDADQDVDEDDDDEHETFGSGQREIEADDDEDDEPGDEPGTSSETESVAPPDDERPGHAKGAGGA